MFKVWLKNLPNGEAPSTIFLNDYTYVCDVEGGAISDAVHKLRADEDSSYGMPRDLSTGDVVQDENDKFSILTPGGVWAEVQAFEDDLL